MKNKIFNIPLSHSFVDVLARRFLKEYGENPLELSDVLFLLPTRRACKALREAFVREQGLKPTILPRMLPIFDIEEDVVLLSSPELLADIKPAVSKTERILRFIKLIMAKPASLGVVDLSSAQACFLASELSRVIDLAQEEGLSFENLMRIVPEEYSAHWQETLKLLEIITNYWPQELEQIGKVDAVWRKNKLLAVQAEAWRKNPPKEKIVIAGTTATYPTMKTLVKTVLGLKNSELILSGLDKNLDEQDWLEVDETHSQFELKDLLDYLEVSRFEVKDMLEPLNYSREVFVSETMRPAKTSHRWRDIGRLKLSPVQATQGLNIINCADIREEALSIALIMREVLETPQKTAALVTGDRNLARRVAAELERWGLEVDDSAGKPLTLTPVGAFMRQIVKVVEADAPVELLALLKHPYCTKGMEKGALRLKVRSYEQKVLRDLKEDAELEALILEFESVLESLKSLMSKPSVCFRELIVEHIKAAEVLAGADILWANDAGEAAASFVADLFENADNLGEIYPKDYAGLFEALMSMNTVRPKFGKHPRLKILGPIESRLGHFDVMILGEMNEGIWPKNAEADPWMSRPMKKEFGFPSPEKAVGIMAFDFSSLLSAKEVYLARADRSAGTPMAKSRWLMRLETVLKALGSDAAELENVAYRSWARYLDRAEVFKRLLPPAPKPPVNARPRELYASAVENLMRDPYIVFAKYILKLKPLEDLEKEISYADYGNIVHAILDEFNKRHSGQLPSNAKEELLALGEKHFNNQSIAHETKAFWLPNFERTVDWLLEIEKGYRPDVAKVFSEVKGSFSFPSTGGVFTISAKADRVDVLKNGKINIIDYKTGQARRQKEVRVGYAPQLPIEGIIAKNGGFDGVSAADVEKLIYWRLNKEEVAIEGDVEEVLETNLSNIKELIELFDRQDTAYKCRPNPAHAPKYSDYEHLARVKEWSVVDDE